MSEARDYFGEYGGARSNVARLRFAANDALNERLVAFHNQAFAATLGRGALFLYSEQSIRYAEERYRQNEYGYIPDVAGLQEVDDLQHHLKHRSTGQRRVAPYAEFKRLPEKESGMLVRMSVVIDELTARVLRGTVFLEDDRTVKVGLQIPARHLEAGTHLLEARDDLMEALETGSPVLAVDSLDLISRQQRP